MSTQACYISTAPTSLTTTSETAVLTYTIPPYSEPSGQGVYMDANVVITSGSATTNVIVRFRLGSGTGGAVVGQPCESAVTASTANQFAGAVVLDQTPAYPQGQTYTVTVQQVAATGNATMQQVTVSASPVINSFTG